LHKQQNHNAPTTASASTIEAASASEGGARVLVVGSLAESLTNFRGDLIKELLDRGNKVFACAPQGSEKWTTAVTDLGAVFVPVHMHRAGMNMIEDLRTLRHLIAIMKEFEIDVVIAYTIKPVIYGSLAAKIASVRCMASIITGAGYAFTNQTLKARLISIAARFLYKLAFRFNHLAFFQNPDDQELFRSAGILTRSTKTMIINGSGVNINKFTERPFPDTISFLMLARLNRAKGVLEYVNACKIVRQQHPQVRCLLAGFIDSNPDSILESDLRHWQDNGYIEYMGPISDAPTLYEACSVYVLPSFREGTPRSVLEAMASGRPIITTNAPGCKETVTDGVNGYKVSVGSSEELAERMIYLIENEQEIASMGKESRRMATEKYDVRIVNNHIVDAVNEASSVRI